MYLPLLEDVSRSSSSNMEEKTEKDRLVRLMIFQKHSMSPIVSVISQLHINFYVTSKK